MSLDFFSDSSIKPWMQIGANQVTSANYMICQRLASAQALTVADTSIPLALTTLINGRGGAVAGDIVNGRWNPITNGNTTANISYGDMVEVTLEVDIQVATPGPYTLGASIFGHPSTTSSEASFSTSYNSLSVSGIFQYTNIGIGLSVTISTLSGLGTVLLALQSNTAIPTGYSTYVTIKKI